MILHSVVWKEARRALHFFILGHNRKMQEYNKQNYLEHVYKLWERFAWQAVDNNYTHLWNFNWNLLLQIVSGRPRQAMHVLLHLIGAAVEFAGHLRGLRRSIDVVGKVRMLCGMLSFKGQPAVLPNSGRAIR